MEIFANVASAQLDGSVNNSVTSVTVKNGVNLPSGGTFRALVGTELLKVTGVSGTTWTVARGDGGTTAASHADGDPLAVVVTKESMDALVSVQASGSEVSNRRILNFTGATVTDNSGDSRCDIAIPASFGDEAAPTAPPTASSFTWDNQASHATATSGSTGLFFQQTVSSSSSDVKVLWIAAPSAPWTLTLRATPLIFDTSGGMIGISFYDSGSGKMATCMYSPKSGGPAFYMDKWNSSTSWSAGYTSINFWPGTRFPWLKLIDDGTTDRTFSVSIDGVNWLQIHSVGRTDFMTPNAAALVACMGGNSGSSRPVSLLVSSWLLQSGVH